MSRSPRPDDSLLAPGRRQARLSHPRSLRTSGADSACLPRGAASSWSSASNCGRRLAPVAPRLARGTAVCSLTRCSTSHRPRRAGTVAVGAAAKKFGEELTIFEALPSEPLVTRVHGDVRRQGARLTVSGIADFEGELMRSLSRRNDVLTARCCATWRRCGVVRSMWRGARNGEPSPVDVGCRYGAPALDLVGVAAVLASVYVSRRRTGWGNCDRRAR